MDFSLGSLDNILAVACRIEFTISGCQVGRRVFAVRREATDPGQRMFRTPNRSVCGGLYFCVELQTIREELRL